VRSIYLANLARLFGVMQGYPVLWSLAVEEQYYLVWPAVVRKLEPVQLLACSLAIVALTPVSRVISMYVMARHGYVSYWFNNYTGTHWTGWPAARRLRWRFEYSGGTAGDC
jgi:peptidoglycan/LPS O-acetylase OafA/YrhL